MNLTTIAVDLAKDVFHVAVADRRYQIVERHRLARWQFERFIREHERSFWVMEACGGAHHWTRTLIGLGHEAKRSTEARPAIGLSGGTDCSQGFLLFP